MPRLEKPVFAFLFFFLTSLTSCNFRDEKTPQVPVDPRQGGPGESPNLATASDFAWLQTNLFNTNCVSCHNSGRATVGIDLSSYATIRSGRSADGDALIASGSPSGSLLVQAIESGRMPPGGKKLSDALLATLKCWIENGAEENSQNAACLSLRGESSQGGGTNTGGSKDGDKGGEKGDGGGQKPGGSTGGTDTGSNGGNGNSNDPDASLGDFAWLQKKLFDAQCISCHNAEFATSGIDLSSHKTISSGQTMGGRSVIVAGRSAESVLVEVITNGFMPPDGPAPSESVLATLRCWIDQGAKAEGQAKACIKLRGDTKLIDKPKVDEPKIDEPKVDEPKIDEPKIDEPKIDEPKIDEPKIDEPKIDEPKIDEPKAVTYVWQDIVSQILIPYRCRSCHAGEFAEADVDLGSYASAMASRKRTKDGVKRPTFIIPGDPEASVFVDVLLPGSPIKMPPGSREVTSDLIEMLMVWIAEGAPENAPAPPASSDASTGAAQGETP